MFVKPVIKIKGNGNAKSVQDKDLLKLSSFLKDLMEEVKKVKC